MSARAGDAASLGLLLERHRPRLLATALRLVGFRPEAEDAVQETCLIAVRYLGSVRDPDAVGAWLETVLRRACLQNRRRWRGELLTESLPDMLDESPSVEDRIEQMELRDWIWGALQRLPDALRVTAMLRYFGSYDSYDEVAAILGTPIGTVRSRLSQAKIKLADALLASAGLIDDALRVRSNDRALRWTNAFTGIFRRGDSDEFVSHFESDAIVGWSNRKLLRGRKHLAAEIDGDLEAGVRLDLERVMTSETISVVEARFVNPPESPDHCPPGIALVLFDKGDKASAIRLHLSPRPPRSADE
jgi:RNA polymerase sigma-70 factor (ECF subfamily)